MKVSLWYRSHHIYFDFAEEDMNHMSASEHLPELRWFVWLVGFALFLFFFLTIGLRFGRQKLVTAALSSAAFTAGLTDLLTVLAGMQRKGICFSGAVTLFLLLLPSSSDLLLRCWGMTISSHVWPQVQCIQRSCCPMGRFPPLPPSSCPYLLLGFFTHYFHLTWSLSNLSASQESQKPWLLFTAGCTTWEIYLESLVRETSFVR